MDTPIDFIKHTKEIKNKDGVVFSGRPQYKIFDNEINYSGYYYIQYCKAKSPQGTKTLDFRSITHQGDIITIVNNPEETKNHEKIENIILESNQLNNTQIYG
ncbi:MAG: hypothetical protein J5598_00370, partial [Clostridia bacterium]|nr:hypothetical protein [Clostridia bacterium]